MNPDLVFPRLNSTVAALQLAAKRRGIPRDCEQAPFTGCQYEVRLAERLGKVTKCESSLFRIDDRREGSPLVFRATSTRIPCPPEVQ